MNALLALLPMAANNGDTSVSLMTVLIVLAIIALIIFIALMVTGRAPWRR